MNNLHQNNLHQSRRSCGAANRRSLGCAATIVVLAVLAEPLPANAADRWGPVRLQCNALVNPGAIDDPQPWLRWIVEHPRRGAEAMACQVLVATQPRLLAEGAADLWDSGRIDLEPALGLRYAGRPLSSAERCFWKVRVWDEQGEASGWSDVAQWNTGLLDGAAWEAAWIGYDAARTPVNRAAGLEGASWIAHAADDANEPPAGVRLYVTRWELPPDLEIESAEALAQADDQWQLAINGDTVVHNAAGWQKIKPVEVGGALRAGRNELRLRVHNLTPGPTGVLLQLTVRGRDGRTLRLVTDGAWRSYADPPSDWSTCALPAELPAAQVCGAYGAAPWGTAEVQELALPPTPLLRREFAVTRRVESAILYATALGVCDAHLNGARVSDEYFTPGWTDYTRRVYYRGYDVTDRIRQGANCLGAVLSDGWYSGYIGWGQIRDHYGTRPRVRMELHLKYADGTREVVATDPRWKAALGPTLEADFLMGESYDARRVVDGWDAAGFDDGAWQAVDVGAELAPTVAAHPAPPVVAFQEITPVAITEPRPGAYVFDLGQNFAGVVRLSLRGQPGQQVRLRFAERLNPDGTVYTVNLREARCTDVYTCRGEGLETWTPRFTFHGFQYVEATGLTEPPTRDTLTGVALSSDTPRAGWFECSHPLLNRLVSNIYWTQRSNFIDIPTDCPQRDERLGWTGDAQVYVATACLNADVQAFFRKWLVDLTDAQRADGQFPMVAPLKVAGDDGGPAWADAGVICPWIAYQVYGDRDLLERQYPSMQRFIDFCAGRSVQGGLPPEAYHCFGDWLSIDADTPKEVIYTAYFAQSARIMARVAETLDKPADAERYRKLYEQIRAAFVQAYVDPQGRVRGDTQCGYVLAIMQDLGDAKQIRQYQAHLAADIERRGHLTTGFIGTKDLMLALAKSGLNDLAYQLLLSESFPSWGFSIKHGATSIWERWDGWTPEKGFQDPGMNSFAHYSFGAVYQWLFENLVGVRRTAPGYARYVVDPQLGGDVRWVRASYDSVRGRIAVAWRDEEEAFTLETHVPVGATAKVVLPVRAQARLVEGDQVLDPSSPTGWPAGIVSLQRAGDRWRCEVGAGLWSFTSE